jgi:proteasome lid subunit RPN8/RPN11
LARPSATRVGTKVLTGACEQCWVLLGERRGRIWHGKSARLSRGEATSVRFDGPWVLEREERRRDVLGFLHTHPAGPPSPSVRDVRTMRAWCSAFGKPLLCLIASPQGLAGYCFADDRSNGVALALLEIFRRGIVVGVESNGK